MDSKCSPKLLSQHNASSTTHLSEIISMRLLKKNPSGALIWGIFGASLLMDGYYYIHFLRRKEYQVTTNNHFIFNLLTLVKYVLH